MTVVDTSLSWRRDLESSWGRVGLVFSADLTSQVRPNWLRTQKAKLFSADVALGVRSFHFVEDVGRAKSFVAALETWV